MSPRPQTGAICPKDTRSQFLANVIAISAEAHHKIEDCSSLIESARRITEDSGNALASPL